MENKRSDSTIIIIIAFCVIASVITLIFYSNKNKVHVDKSTAPTEEIRSSVRVAQTLKVHRDLMFNDYKVKPLLTSLTKAYCPGETQGYVPICTRCNVPLEKTANKNIFKCPICGQETTVRCPHDHRVNMGTLENYELSSILNWHGYICPVCASMEAPLWDNHGLPICPYCKNIMKMYKIR
ncbi:MAG: hypothetical protein HQK51_08160 [Oligoflexia bacterium]|nr:hypothetical protein [Oligoflexia bacterium]